MRDNAVPGPVGRFLSQPALGLLCRLALAAPFAISGVVKLTDFAGSVNEVAALGVPHAAYVVPLVIAIQLGGSLLFLTARFCWLGGGLLAGFTVVATFLAHSFWTVQGPDRPMQTATFFEHVAIAGGLLLAAAFVHARPRRP